MIDSHKHAPNRVEWYNWAHLIDKVWADQKVSWSSGISVATPLDWQHEVPQPWRLLSGPIIISHILFLTLLKYNFLYEPDMSYMVSLCYNLWQSVTLFPVTIFTWLTKHFCLLTVKGLTCRFPFISIIYPNLGLYVRWLVFDISSIL